MLLRIIALSLICLPLYSVQVDEDKFNQLVDTQMQAIEDGQELLWDASDEYTYYYLLGKYAGFEMSKEIFQECIE